MAQISKESVPDFRQMWMEAEKSFQNKTGKTITGSRKSLDDVMSELDAKFSNNHSTEKEKRIHQLVSNTLVFVKVLAGLAAQGASNVFAPASQCFNAVSFLIDIPFKIGKFYEDLATLFEEIVVFTKQFKIYRRIEDYTEIDVDLRWSTHKLMITFVEICAISIDILGGSKWEVFKKRSKLVLFDDDSGVTSKLKEFRTLVQRQSSISDAITLECVLKSAEDRTKFEKQVLKLLDEKSDEVLSQLGQVGNSVDDISEKATVLYAAENDRKTQRLATEDMKKICRELGISETTKQDVEKYLSTIKQKNVEGTAQWLHQLPKYTEWANPTTDDSQLLLIEGGNDSGKSHLAVAIEDKLRHPEISLAKTSITSCIAFHAITRKSEKREGIKNDKSSRGENEGDTRPVSGASLPLRSIIGQLAEQNARFRLDLVKLIENGERSFSKGSCEDVARTFQKVIATQNITCFLIIDGVDQLTEDEPFYLLHSLCRLRSRRLRIFVTGTEEVFRSCLAKIEVHDDITTKINVKENNDTDIKCYIEEEMKRLNLLQEDKAEINYLREKINRDVPEIVKGNFGHVRHMLDVVKEAVERERPTKVIEELINESTLDKNGKAERLVDELNESLNPDEIERLNELLVWTIYSIEYMRIEELKAAMFLRFREVPLYSLEWKIEKKYSNIFKRKSPDSIIVMDYIEEYFRSTKRLGNTYRDDEDVDEPRISVTINIKQAKISQVQRFFWDLSKRAIFEEFAFDETSMAVNSKAKLNANFAEAHLLLIDRCFTLLSEEPVPETKILLGYALRELPFHLLRLKEAIDQGQITPQERREVAQKLVSFLSEPEYLKNENISTWLGAAFSWLDWKQSLPPLWDILNDPEAKPKLGKRRELSWFKEVMSDDQKKVLMLKEMARIVASRWLYSDDLNASEHFRWLDPYLKELFNRSVDDEKTESVIDTKRTNEKQDKINQQATNMNEKAFEREEENSTIKEDKLEIDDEKILPKREIEREAKIQADSNTEDSTSATLTVDELMSLIDDNDPLQPQDALRYSESAISKRVVLAMKWALGFLGKSEIEKDSLFFERLGWTFIDLDSSEFPAYVEIAKKVFSRAKTLSNDSVSLSAGLGLIHASEDKLHAAIEELELKLLRATTARELSDRQTSMFTYYLWQIGDWKARLGKYDEAITHLRLGIQLKSDYWGVYEKLFEVLILTGQHDEVLELLDSMNNKTALEPEKKKLMQLDVMLLEGATFGSLYELINKTLVPVLEKEERAVMMLKSSLCRTLDFTKERDCNDKEINVATTYGIFLSRYSKDANDRDLAIKQLQKCYDIYLRPSYIGSDPLLLPEAGRQLSTHYFAEAVQAMSNDQDPETAVSKLAELFERVKTVGILANPSLKPLAAWYSFNGKPEKSRQMLSGAMREALSLLTDDDPDNDEFGFWLIAEISLHTNDALNAMSALSMCKPSDIQYHDDDDGKDAPKEAECASHESEGHGADLDKPKDNVSSVPKRQGHFEFICNVCAKGQGAYASDMWICTICDNTTFDNACVEKLRNGNLPVWCFCSKDHKLFYWPPWSDEEARKVGRGNVRVGGELIDGTRVGGRIVSVGEWLDMLREEWAIPKPIK